MVKKLELSAVQIASATAILVLVGYGVGHFAEPKPKYAANDLREVDEIYRVLKSKFDGPVDKNKLIVGAKEGFVAATEDPYTVYLDDKAAKELADDLSGTFSGIGAEIGLKGGQLGIIAPIADSPAERVGLKPKDAILQINDQPTDGLPLDQAVAKIRGPKGTTVKLKVGRADREPFDVTVTRDVITVSSVKSELKPGSIGYLKVSRFGPDTTEAVKQAAATLKGQGASKFVLDLRNDPGGFLDTSVDVASQFLDGGKLVVEERHSGKSIDKLNAKGGGLLVGRPVVVLINAGSASASEIVAGALQDQKAATVVGEKSYGKGSVQEIEKLSGGAELKVTVAHWFTPSGKSIDKEGIRPDEEVKKAQADDDAGRDPQLDRALQILATK